MLWAGYPGQQHHKVFILDCTQDRDGRLVLTASSGLVHGSFNPTKHSRAASEDGKGSEEWGIWVDLAAYGTPFAPPREPRKTPAPLRRLWSGGVLCVWRVDHPAAPWHLLRCVGLPACCLVCAAKPHLAFAGTSEGSVQVTRHRHRR